MDLALETLEPGEERTLRAHLDTCSGCRDYLTELSSLGARLRLAQKSSDVEATEAFHQNVMREVRTVRDAKWEVRRWPFSWRVVVPGTSGLAAGLAILLYLVVRPGTPPQAPGPNQAQASRSLEATLAPSVANYRLAANRSLDQFDELLTRQANRRGVEVSVLTASVLAANSHWSD